MKLRSACVVVVMMFLVSAAAPCRAADGDSPPRESPPRSKSFPVLAVTYAVLNGLDAYTTTRAIQSGAGVEANPIMAPVAGNPAALIALKSASTASTIFMAHRLWKRHRTGAIVLMVVANVATGMIVSHNAMVLSR